MLDAALFLFVLGFFALGVRRPFVWVLAYLYIDILAPHKIGWGLMQMFPLSLIAFCAAFGGWLLTDTKKDVRFTFRQGLLLFFMLWCFYTLQSSPFPEDAYAKWDWVWKAMFFAIFLPFTLMTRLRLEAAAMTMVLAVGAIIISAGMKTATGGGGYASLYFFVNDNSGLYESSTLATVSIGIIPLILWFTKHGTIFAPDWRVKLFCYALVFACLLIPVGTEARTGLVCIAVLLVLALRDVKRRALFMIAGASLGMMAIPFLPQSYFERMSTIASHDGDQSASTRVAVWEWTWEYVQNNPRGGGFDIYRANKFTYQLPQRTGEGNTRSIEYKKVVDEGRAFHSSYFEVLGEQGYLGFGVWAWLQLLGLWHMERIRRKWRKRTGDGERWQAPFATALQYAHVIYLVGALFQGIAYQPFIMMLIGLQIALHVYCKRLDSPIKRGIGATRARPASAKDKPAVAAAEPALR
ncbi:DUF5935 domain-containing protein [Qipengyuania sp. DSG2-2]|uniref:DUF5935 domain-containing protein n=1 Tax=Qipengyuania sp. DGS2-2 TaxID=3349631 RepID=UPI0036D41F64